MKLFLWEWSQKNGFKVLILTHFYKKMAIFLGI